MAKVRKTCTFSLDDETRARLQAFAKANHKSMSQVLTDLLWGHSLDVPDDTNTIGEVILA